MKTNIGISEKNRKEVADILGKLLADEFVLYTKTLRAHWNLEGHDFHTKHVFFEEHYDAIKQFTDSVAERIRKIGHYSPGTLKEFLDLTNLSEKYDGDNTSPDYTVALLKYQD
jgi:starvation-inducible DNA-binding protein